MAPLSRKCLLEEPYYTVHQPISPLGEIVSVGACIFSSLTLISLINVEVGINVEGYKKAKITKRGGWNKRGGWDFFEKLVHKSNKRGVEGEKI